MRSTVSLKCLFGPFSTGLLAIAERQKDNTEMCGIAGIVKTDKGVSPDVLVHMIRSLQHRGPDGESIWISDCQKVGFGHSRLSIIDLSDLENANGFTDWAISNNLNGEIYNYQKLRNRLRSDGLSSEETLILRSFLLHWTGGV